MKKKIIFLICSMFFIPSLVSAGTKEEVLFSKCVDGDTIKVLVDGEEKTVRFLAIDTPESVHPTKGVEYYGKEASNYTCEKVKNASLIVLEYDDGSSKEDKYHRLLAWVFVDDELLQDLLIKNGYAEVAYLYGNYQYTALLQDHEAVAKAQKIGIWNEEERDRYNSENNIKEDITEENTNSMMENDTEESKLNMEEMVMIAFVLIVALVIGGKKSAKKLLKKALK